MSCTPEIDRDEVKPSKYSSGLSQNEDSIAAFAVHALQQKLDNKFGQIEPRIKHDVVLRTCKDLCAERWGWV